MEPGCVTLPRFDLLARGHEAFRGELSDGLEHSIPCAVLVRLGNQHRLVGEARADLADVRAFVDRTPVSCDRGGSLGAKVTREYAEASERCTLVRREHVVAPFDGGAHGSMAGLNG